jgi:hypothetical protein
MRHTSATAALLAAAVIGGLGLNPSTAQARTGPQQARAAWIKSCGKTDAILHPCGHWRLLLGDGEQLTVSDSAPAVINGKGKKELEQSLFAVSGDGRVIAYERAHDHRLVVRSVAGGPVKVLPASLVPKRYGTSPLVVYLSYKGDKALVASTEDRMREPGKVVTVATGKIVKLPARDSVKGFSADGGEVLTQRYHGDNTLELIAHRLDGTSIKRTPPQVVANAEVTALAADGRTVAVFVMGDEEKKKAPRLRLYDLGTGDLSASVELALKPSQTPYTAYWTPDGKLTALVQSGDEGSTAVVRVLTVDTETGAVAQTDKYSISKTRFAYSAAGE